MQVTVESVSNLERKLTVEIPAAEIDGEVESRLNSMRAKVKLDGFRPGKTPISEVRKRYGKDVHQEVIGEVMQRTFSVSYTHLRAPRDATLSRMPSSA